MENRITGHTQLYCLLGTPVEHSGSPAMYNYSFVRTGVDAVYLAFDVPLEHPGRRDCGCEGAPCQRIQCHHAG